MSPHLRDPTSNHTPTPVPPFSSVFSLSHLLPPKDLNMCCPHARSTAPCPAGGRLTSVRHVSLVQKGNLRLHHLAAHPLFSIALHAFSPQLLSQRLSMHLLAYFIIICHFHHSGSCMRTGAMSFPLTTIVPALRAMLGT